MPRMGRLQDDAFEAVLMGLREAGVISYEEWEADRIMPKVQEAVLKEFDEYGIPEDIPDESIIRENAHLEQFPDWAKEDNAANCINCGRNFDIRDAGSGVFRHRLFEAIYCSENCKNEYLDKIIVVRLQNERGFYQ